MSFVENKNGFNEINIDLISQTKRRNDTYQDVETNLIAAITIQRYYRGYHTRIYISKLNLAATVIQKYWRGYLTRRYEQ